MSPIDTGNDQSISEATRSAPSESKQQRRLATENTGLSPKVAENREDSTTTPSFSPPLVDEVHVLTSDGTEGIDTTGDGTPTTTRILTRGTLDATTETPERNDPRTIDAVYSRHRSAMVQQLTRRLAQRPILIKKRKNLKRSRPRAQRNGFYRITSLSRFN